MLQRRYSYGGDNSDDSNEWYYVITLHYYHHCIVQESGERVCKERQFNLSCSSFLLFSFTLIAKSIQNKENVVTMCLCACMSDLLFKWIEGWLMVVVRGRLGVFHSQLNNAGPDQKRERRIWIDFSHNFLFFCCAKEFRIHWVTVSFTQHYNETNTKLLHFTSHYSTCTVYVMYDNEEIGSTLNN